MSSDLFDTERIKVVFNSKKVTDHHAIIPTISSVKEDVSELPLSEAKVYFLISDKFHASVGYPLIENTTKIVASFDGFEFTSSGKVIKDEGFSKYLKEYKSKKSEDGILRETWQKSIIEFTQMPLKTNLYRINFQKKKSILFMQVKRIFLMFLYLE